MVVRDEPEIRGQGYMPVGQENQRARVKGIQRERMMQIMVPRMEECGWLEVRERGNS